MNKYALIFCCLFFFGFSLYSYVEKQNQVTALKLRLPEVTKEIKALREENTRLRFEIDTFENPDNLLKLAARPEFAHLKHPLSTEILTVREGLAVTWEPAEDAENAPAPQSTIRLATSNISQ